MTQKTRFKAGQLALSISDREQIEKELLTDLNEIETIFSGETAKEPDLRRINRLFKGSNQADSVNRNIKIGMNLVRFESENTLTENRLTQINQDESADHYLFNSYSRQKREKVLAGFLVNDVEILNADLLFAANEKFEPQRFSALNLSRRTQSSRLLSYKIRESKEQIRKTLPASIYSKIQWQNWDHELFEKVNVQFDHQIFLNENALAHIPILDGSNYTARYGAFLDSLARDGVTLLTPRQSGETGSHDFLLPPSEKYTSELRALGPILAFAFDPNQPIEERRQHFLKLRKHALFRETGAGFLVSLIPIDQLEDSIYYRLSISGKKTKNVDFIFGKNLKRDLYDTLMHIQNTMNNRSIDLRLLRESSK
jgi:hypothetical protein